MHPLPYVTTISHARGIFCATLSVPAVFFLSRHFLPCCNDFFAVLCRVCLSSSRHFLFPLAFALSCAVIALPSVLFCSLFAGLCFRLSVPFPPLKKRTGRQSRAVLPLKAMFTLLHQTKNVCRQSCKPSNLHPAQNFSGNSVFPKQRQSLRLDHDQRRRTALFRR